MNHGHQMVYIGRTTNRAYPFTSWSYSRQQGIDAVKSQMNFELERLKQE